MAVSFKKRLRLLYDKIPGRQIVFSALRRFYRPGEKIYWYLYFQGKFKVAVDNEHAFWIQHHGFGFLLENLLFWEGLDGNWEKVSIRLWQRLCADAEGIFDIGANTGIYSLVAKSINPKSKVYAFEPVTRIFEKLCLNNELNDFDISCHQKALSNSDGSATIYDLPDYHVYSVTVNKNLHNEESVSVPIEIETIRLDTFVKDQGIDHIDLMKIDVETHEAEVLRGFGSYLQKYKPTILIELLNDQVARNVEEIVKDLGYLYFNVDEKTGLRPVTHLSKSDYYNFLLCSKEVALKLGILGHDQVTFDKLAAAGSGG